MKISVQTVSAFKVFERAQFCFKPLASSIVSKRVSCVAAQLLHADRIEHALSPYCRDQERLLYKPASYRVAEIPGSAAIRDISPGYTTPPTHSRQQ